MNSERRGVGNGQSGPPAGEMVDELMQLVVPNFPQRERLKSMVDGKKALMVSFRLDPRDMDGVSLEGGKKWVDVLERAGAQVELFSGQTYDPRKKQQDPEATFEECHFTNPHLQRIQAEMFHRDDISQLELDVLTGKTTLDGGHRGLLTSMRKHFHEIRGINTRVNFLHDHVEALEDEIADLAGTVGEGKTLNAKRRQVNELNAEIDRENERVRKEMNLRRQQIIRELDSHKAGGQIKQLASMVRDPSEDIMIGVRRLVDLDDLMERKTRIKNKLVERINKTSSDFLIAENILSLPGNFALSLAFVEAANETGKHVLAHHHDFYWERDRYPFKPNGNMEKLMMHMIDGAKSKSHTVINSDQEFWMKSRGIKNATVVPNVMDFEHIPQWDEKDDARVRRFREQLGVWENDILLVAPVRPVPRKDLELTLELALRVQKRLDEEGLNRKVRLLITHPSLDEGHEYVEEILKKAWKAGIRTFYTRNIIKEVKGEIKHMGVEFIRRKDREDPDYTEGEDHTIERTVATYRKFDLATAYRAGFTAYTPEYEGFGNAALEAWHNFSPLIVRRYEKWDKDIRGKGDDNEMEFVVEMDIKKDTQKEKKEEELDKAAGNIIELRNSPALRHSIASRAYSYGLIFFNYEILTEKLADSLESWATAA